MAATLYTLEIIIIRAEHVPVADINNFTSDPYILATLHVPGVHSASQSDLTYRTKTIHRTLEPTFNAHWLVSGVPIPLPSSEPITLTLELSDEDPGGRHDLLGRALARLDIKLDNAGRWDSGEVECKVQKRKGDVKDHVATYIAGMLTCGRVQHRSRVWVRARVVGEAEDQKDRRVYTLGPHKWSQHPSPLIGHLISSGTAQNDTSALPIPNTSTHHSSPSTFIANRLQLAGPIPPELRHRYVGYRPFIKRMFKAQGIEGWVLSHGLKKQYRMVYAYGRETVYGVIGEDGGEDGGNSSHTDAKINGTGVEHGNEAAEEAKANPHPDASLASPDSNSAPPPPAVSDSASSLSTALARQFLRMTSHGTHGRLFTYVIMLDGEWRFTETGEEFAVDLLSKHSMHADLAIEIAFSGEFFVRRVGDEEVGVGGDVSEDPKDYELVIDNDSGTYRPKKELLPVLQEWLSRPGKNLSALGKVTVMDGFDPVLEGWKQKRKEVKRRAKGLKIDEKKEKKEEEEKKEQQEKAGGGNGKKEETANGDAKGESVMDGVLKEDAKRAEENGDLDPEAKEEEKETGG